MVSTNTIKKLLHREETAFTSSPPSLPGTSLQSMSTYYYFPLNLADDDCFENEAECVEI